MDIWVAGVVTKDCCTKCHFGQGYCNHCEDLGDSCCKHEPECDVCFESRMMDNYFNPDL